MPLLSRLLTDYTLTKKLRDYSVKNVKIAEADKSRTKALVRDYIEGEIFAYCRENSALPIQRLEYTGSVYERLKSEFSDEVDVMVVLKTDTPWLSWLLGDAEVLVEDTNVPGYVRLKAREDSKLRQYANPGGYVNAERLRNGWFHSLIAQAVNAFNGKSPGSEVSFIVRYHGPAVQLDIMKRGTYQRLLSVDLVACFENGYDEYLVPKTSTSLNVHHPDLLWRRSFSVREKRMLQSMDRNDHGCRHELLRIVKTIVKRERTSFGRIESYHLKTAFMHYITKQRENWAGRNSLGKHFVGFLEEFQCPLRRGNLPHFWIPGVNLLEDTNEIVVEQMANRLKRILNSEAELDSILSIGRIQMEGTVSTEEGHVGSWLSLGLELVLVVLENAFACIVFGIKLVIVIVLAFVFVCAVLLSVDRPPHLQPDA